MKKPTIAIIGAGNMGSCIAGGLIKSGHPSDQLWISNPSKAKLEKLQKTFSLHISTDNTEILQFADVIIFALKPQVFKEATMALAHALPSPKPLIISIAAGIRENSIAAWLGDETLSIVRAMPNLPALIGCGATALHANNNVSATEHHLAETILGTIGMITWLNNESLMDTVTALSG
ncbi:MAG: NAD(P)-binding domain-containing protein, partial [Gammaproteobacteria bacterium]|nr:NAD(P)-binding domain-containing protein [Gammaproteobacteria bacterium]